MLFKRFLILTKTWKNKLTATPRNFSEFFVNGQKDMKKIIKFGIVVLVSIIFLVGCKPAKVDLNYLYNEILQNVDMEPYDEYGWIDPEPTGAKICYGGHKFLDVTGDGIDELFIMRFYVPVAEKITYTPKDEWSSFWDKKLRREFIGEAYTIKDKKVEALKVVDHEMVATQAFNGGHFGTYYFLLNGGKIGRSYSSYSNVSLEVYKNLKLENSLTYDRDYEQDRWYWQLNGKEISRRKALNFLNGV